MIFISGQRMFAFVGAILNYFMTLEPIIGLEIHIQMKAKSKMFCSCSNESDEAAPNTNICPICLGHPGTLPQANEQAVELGVMMALALNCLIKKKSVWARKNYFYPDLSKGYQISQFEEPLAENGHLTVEVKEKKYRIGITRLHLEEDAAKNFHAPDQTLVDYNRAGTPLMEIVTEPDFRSPEEAKIFLQELRLLARYLGVSDADMEKGHLRCDANISLRPAGEDKLYPKTEIKNLNSFKAVARALEYEVKRQTDEWQKGTPVNFQSTRGWDENQLKTVEQRKKEGAADYRYFPEPDLPEIILSATEVEQIKAALPELPQAKKQRFITEYGLKLQDAQVLIEDKAVADYFEEVMMEMRTWSETLEETEGTSEEIWARHKAGLTKLVSGWLLSELFKLMNQAGQPIEEVKITPENFAEFVTLVYQRKVNSSAAQVLLKEMYASGGDPSHIMEEKDLSQIGDAGALTSVIERIIKDNPEQVRQYLGGKEPLLKFFIGLAMKATKGKGDPEKLSEIIKEKIHNPG